MALGVQVYKKLTGKKFLQPLIQHLHKYAKVDPKTGIPFYHIRFQKDETVSFRLRVPYSSTPLGVYAYPLTERTIQDIAREGLPFAFERKYVALMKLTPYSSPLVIAEDSSILYKPPHVSNEIAESIVGLLQSETGAAYLHRLITTYGIYTVIDLGAAVIHPNEPYQTVFLHPKAYKVIDVFPNYLVKEKAGIAERYIPDKNLVVAKIYGTNIKLYKSPDDSYIRRVEYPNNTIAFAITPTLFIWTYPKYEQQWKQFLSTKYAKWFLDLFKTVELPNLEKHFAYPVFYTPPAIQEVGSGLYKVSAGNCSMIVQLHDNKPVPQKLICTDKVCPGVVHNSLVCGKYASLWLNPITKQKIRQLAAQIHPDLDPEELLYQIMQPQKTEVRFLSSKLKEEVLVPTIPPFDKAQVLETQLETSKLQQLGLSISLKFVRAKLRLLYNNGSTKDISIRVLLG